MQVCTDSGRHVRDYVTIQAKPEAQLITERATTTREFKQTQGVLLRHMKNKNKLLED